MSKPLSIDPVVLRRSQKLPKSERVECLLALCESAETLGQPHVHNGLPRNVSFQDDKLEREYRMWEALERSLTREQ